MDIENGAEGVTSQADPLEQENFESVLLGSEDKQIPMTPSVPLIEQLVENLPENLKFLGESPERGFSSVEIDVSQAKDRSILHAFVTKLGSHSNDGGNATSNSVSPEIAKQIQQAVTSSELRTDRLATTVAPEPPELTVETTTAKKSDAMDLSSIQGANKSAYHRMLLSQNVHESYRIHSSNETKNVAQFTNSVTLQEFGARQLLDTRSQSAVPLSAKSNLIMQQLSKPILIGAINRGLHSSLEVRLDPPELGSVLIRINETANGITAQLVANHESTAQLVANQISQLENTLKDAGITIDEFHISHDDMNFNEQSHDRDESLDSEIPNQLDQPKDNNVVQGTNATKKAQIDGRIDIIL